MKFKKKKKDKKKKNDFFLEIGIFFFKLGKKSPESHLERGRISAPEDTKKYPCHLSVVSKLTQVRRMGALISIK